MRTMQVKIADKRMYYSAFEPETGNLVRITDWPNYNHDYDTETELKELGYNRSRSPSPELCDIAITNRCNVGCEYCYQDSTPKAKHGRKDLVETILKGFDHVPYQIAIGGGEPTLHPDFTYILRKARELGTVPNYTTAGVKLTKDILDATNEVCGGVAITYHAFKGLDWFKTRYAKLAESLKCQINVHVIADQNVVTNIRTLMNAGLGKINFVLLAYYPDVGRASIEHIMSKKIYNIELPQVIKEMVSAKHTVAFSEGLFPYFNSRPEIGVTTRFAEPSEGYYSCYFDMNGELRDSSFSGRSWIDIRDQNDNFISDDKTVFNMKSQALWNGLRVYRSLSGDNCGQCPKQDNCVIHNDFHYLICAHASNNSAKKTSLRIIQ